jgi:hypothetical protein
VSKGRVWNKGKHNGGPPKGSKSIAPAKAIDSLRTNNESDAGVGAPGGNAGGTSHRVDLVKRMNRDNWVERQTRASRDTPK